MTMVPSVVFDAFGLAVIVATIVFVFRNPTLPGAGAAGIMALMAFACLFVGSIDRIETFKASVSGIEAKTREVQQVLDSAKATVSSLNQLAKDIVAIEVDLIAGANRIEADSKHKDALKVDLLRKLKALGLDENSVKEVGSADKSYVIFDYATAVLQELNTPSDKDKRAAYTRVFTNGPPPTPDESEALLRQFGITNPEKWELLKDYRVYVTTGEQRRPEVWANRDNWQP
jgi:hypothetical protein